MRFVDHFEVIMRSVLRGLCSVAALLVVAGCGDSGPPKEEVYYVSGVVTGGEGDLTGCQITFNAATPDGLCASGKIEAGGKYTLESTDGRSGCPAGSFKVTLGLSPDAAKQAMMKAMSSKMPGKMGPPKVSGPFPAKYASFETTDKTVEVKKESNTIDIAL
jgi:hypothetical protein